MKGSVLHIGAGQQINKVTFLLIMCSSVTHINSSNAATLDTLFPNHNKASPSATGDLSSPSIMPIVHSVSDYFDVSIHLPAFSPDELSWHDPHL